MPHAPNQCKVLIMEQLSKQKFKRGVQWLSWSGVLATVGAGSILAYSLVFNQPTTPISVRVATVERGTIEESVNESGTLELGNQQILKSPAEATVEQVLVQLGTGVKAGRELIVLRDPERETIRRGINVGKPPSGGFSSGGKTKGCPTRTSEVSDFWQCRATGYSGTGTEASKRSPEGS